MYPTFINPRINTTSSPLPLETPPQRITEINFNYDGDEDDSESFGEEELEFSLMTSTSSRSESLPNLQTATPTQTHQYQLKKKKKKRRSESELNFGYKRNSLIKTSTPISPIVPSPTTTPTQIPPLRAHCDLANSVGARRGVWSDKDQGVLSVVLFTFFYFSDEFDEWILDEKNMTSFPTKISKEIRSILRKEVLYSLRTSYHCPGLVVDKLSCAIFPQGKEPIVEFTKFFRHFFINILSLPEPGHYTNGSSRFVHDLIPQPQDNLLSSSFSFSKSKSFSKGKKKTPEKIVTVQNLFEQSLGDLKLLSLPFPALFLSLEHRHKQLVIPNIQLDLTKTLITLSSEDDTGDSYSEKSKSKKKELEKENYYFFPICQFFRSACKVIYEYLHNLAAHGAVPYLHDSITESWSYSCLSDHEQQTDCYDVEGQTNKKRKRLTNKGKLVVALDLMSVITQDSEGMYSVYQRCGQNPRRGWAPFVHHCKGTTRRVEDVGKWLKRLETKPEKNLNKLPQDLLKMMENSVFLIYSPKPDYESQATLFNYNFVKE